MDDRIRHIIESGLLESYLLNLTSESETQEIDNLLSRSSELREAFGQLEDMQYAMTETIAVKPPIQLKASIKQAIKAQETVNPRYQPETITKSTKPKSRSLWMLILLLAAAVACGAYLFLEKQKLDSKNKELLAQIESIESDKLQINRLLVAKDAQLSFINNTGTKKLALRGNDKASKLKLIAYWNDDLQKSLLSVIDLPSPPKGKCYQMWADVDGEMLDLGVVNISNGIIDWKYLENAESLNVTIEPEGGSKHPTVSNLVANINV